MRKAYQTDLSDAEWEVIESHLPVPIDPGRPRVHSLREILDAVSSPECEILAALEIKVGVQSEGRKGMKVKQSTSTQDYP